MPAPDLKVVTLYKSNHRDIPQTLKQIAEAIASGSEGEVVEASLVIRRADDTLDVFAVGAADVSSTIVLLEKGKFKVMLMCATEM